MGASSGRQFLLLLWKNWLLQKRRKLLTFFEIGLPIFMFVYLLVFRQITSSTPYDEPRTWDAFSIENFKANFTSPRRNCTLGSCEGEDVPLWKIAYSPDNAVTRGIIGFASTKLNLTYEGGCSVLNMVTVASVLLKNNLEKS